MPSIINSDNGAVSGSAGLKFTSADDGVLQIQNNGNTAISISSSGQATFNAPVSQPGAFMFRNKLINGNFDIWQRGTSTTSSAYLADRWVCASLGSTKTASRQAFALGQTDVPNNPSYFMRHVVTSVAGSGNYASMDQKIEGVKTLSGGPATISFWAKADANKNISVEFLQYFGSGGSPSSFVIADAQLVALTTSWAKYTITADIPSISGKTLGTDVNDDLHVTFWFDAGSTYDARAASLGQQSGTFDIAQVQIEEGTAATPFEQRPYGVELSLCQRYFFTGFVSRAWNFTGTTLAVGQSFSFPTTMRSTPTVTLSGSPASIVDQSVSGFSAYKNSIGSGGNFSPGTCTADAEL